MMSDDPILSESTKLTVKVLIVFLGFCAWITQIYFQGNANAKSIGELAQKQDRIEQMAIDLGVIKHDITDIKNRMERSDDFLKGE